MFGSHSRRPFRYIARPSDGFSYRRSQAHPTLIGWREVFARDVRQGNVCRFADKFWQRRWRGNLVVAQAFPPELPGLTEPTLALTRLTLRAPGCPPARSRQASALFGPRTMTDSPAFRPLHSANAIRCGEEKGAAPTRTAIAAFRRRGNCRDSQERLVRARQAGTPEAARLRPASASAIAVSAGFACFDFTLGGEGRGTPPV